jgi:hypothetical protein
VRTELQNLVFRAPLDKDLQGRRRSQVDRVTELSCCIIAKALIDKGSGGKGLTRRKDGYNLAGSNLNEFAAHWTIIDFLPYRSPTVIR